MHALSALCKVFQKVFYNELLRIFFYIIISLNQKVEHIRRVVAFICVSCE